MPDISLRMLKNVLSIQSKSTYSKDSKDNDLQIRRYIKSVLSSNNIKHFEDGYGNIYAVKGKTELYDCIVAHVDTVHNINNNVEVNRNGDYLYAFDPINVKQAGIGGDDLVGVYIALQALKDRDNIKAVFYRNEEIGKLGSKFSISNNKTFYSNCKFVIQNDRKNNTDFIVKSSGIDICSNSFKKDAKIYLDKNGYKESTGLSSDIDTLVSGGIGISAVNLSCGYFRPHSDTEVVSISDVKRAYSLTTDLFDNLIKKYKHTYTPPKNTNNNQYYFSGYNTNTGIDDVYAKQHSSEYKETLNKIDSTKKNEYKLFLKLKGVDFYILKNHEDIEVPIKGHTCSECSKEETTYFIPDENRFFCISCNKFINNDLNLRKKLIIKDSKHVFYHNGINNRWIRDNAVWDNTFDFYRHKRYGE